jgi:hypothetical protein
VLLTTSNIGQCSVRLTAGEDIFETREQSLRVVPTEAQTTVDFTLMPIVRTSTPVWLSIEADGDGLVQQAGFFLTVR